MSRSSMCSVSTDRDSISSTPGETVVTDQTKLQKKLITFDQYRVLFVTIKEIIEVISEQIFDKIATIPYSIRQFCKCLY